MLTHKQEEFAQGVANGLTQSDAYRAAYDVGNMTDKSIHELSSKLASDIKVASRIDDLREEIEALRLWSRAKSIKVLAEVAGSGRGNERVGAVKELNAMQGYLAPQKSESVVRQSIEVVFKSAG